VTLLNPFDYDETVPAHLTNNPFEQTAEDIRQSEELAAEAEWLLACTQELESRARRNMLKFWFPDSDVIHPFEPTKTFFAREKYPKHLEFMRAGKHFNQRMFMAANQVGKTTVAAVEVTYHVTGLYPDWWEGRRLNGPSQWWIAGETNRDVKEIMQDRLIGPPDGRGNGLIPYDCLILEAMVETQKADTPVPTIKVRHFDADGNQDGVSTITFKSYEAGRKSFQGLPRNVWLDEEPGVEIYGECVARLTSDDTLMLMMTFTPLQGTTPTIQSFLPNGFQDNGPVLKDGAVTNKYFVNATDMDVPHISDAKRAENEDTFPEYQKEARRMGRPVLGSGAIYPLPRSQIICPPLDPNIPALKHYKRVFALDVGWNWTAACWFAIDPASGVWYLYSEHKMSQTEPIGHAEVIRSRGLWIPGVIDSAANGRGQDGGEALIEQYRKLGMNVTNANKSVEAGIYQVWTQLRAGMLKICENCQMTLQEMENYHRDEKGKIVKANDHLMDALRYGIMSGSTVAKQQTPPQAYAGQTGVGGNYRNMY
jgi:phage terminase large subunit-like protein